jgi:hypothetical protein
MKYSLKNLKTFKDSSLFHTIQRLFKDLKDLHSNLKTFKDFKDRYEPCLINSHPCLRGASQFSLGVVLGAVSGLFWSCFGVVLGLVSGVGLGLVLGLFRCCLGVVLGACTKTRNNRNGTTGTRIGNDRNRNGTRPEQSSRTRPER